MSKRVAIPVYEGKLSGHFGHCESFAFIDIEDNQIKGISLEDAPEHSHGSFPRWIAKHGATDVLAGGIGSHAIEIFNELGINVFVGAPTKSVEELANDYLHNRLTLQANYCDNHGDHDHHHHDHDHHHHDGHHQH